MKRKILIASFLKPVIDIRAYEKMAVSIAKNNRYEVYCTGYPVNSEIIDKKVQLIPLKTFSKSRLSRIAARWQVWKLYIKLKPELIIVNSPDLLLITTLYRILFGGKICYDIQENYFRNLWFQRNYPAGIRHILALFVRMIEVTTSPLFHHFFLAEKVYKNQLRFIGKRYTLLENKSLKPKTSSEELLDTSSPVFIISGTLATEYGLKEGIDFFEHISNHLPKAKLQIIGHCPNERSRSWVENRIKNQPKFEGTISATPLPHTQLLEAISKSNFGLLPYLPNKSTEGKWPTKLYEYMGYKLPFIIQSNSLWNTFVEQTHSGLAFDFTTLNEASIKQVIQQLNTNQFYKDRLPQEIFWNSEEDKLLNTIEGLL